MEAMGRNREVLFFFFK